MDNPEVNPDGCQRPRETHEDGRGFLSTAPSDDDPLQPIGHCILRNDQGTERGNEATQTGISKLAEQRSSSNRREHTIPSSTIGRSLGMLLVMHRAFPPPCPFCSVCPILCPRSSALHRPCFGFNGRRGQEWKVHSIRRPRQNIDADSPAVRRTRHSRLSPPESLSRVYGIANRHCDRARARAGRTRHSGCWLAEMESKSYVPIYILPEDGAAIDLRSLSRCRTVICATAVRAVPLMSRPTACRFRDVRDAKNGTDAHGRAAVDMRPQPVPVPAGRHVPKVFKDPRIPDVNRVAPDLQQLRQSCRSRPFSLDSLDSLGNGCLSRVHRKSILVHEGSQEVCS